MGGGGTSCTLFCSMWRFWETLSSAGKDGLLWNVYCAVGAYFYMVLLSRAQNFSKKSTSHLKMLGIRKVIWRKYHTENLQTLSATACLFLACSPHWARASSFIRVLDHTKRRTTVGRTHLEEWWARHRDLYLTTHNTHNRQTSMPLVGFETTISAGERPQIHALDRAATGTGKCDCTKVMPRGTWSPGFMHSWWRQISGCYELNNAISGRKDLPTGSSSWTRDKSSRLTVRLVLDGTYEITHDLVTTVHISDCTHEIPHNLSHVVTNSFSVSPCLYVTINTHQISRTVYR
jgi:hypothetical protein